METCGGDSDIRVSMAFDNWSFKCESDESHCRVLISTWEVGGGIAWCLHIKMIVSLVTR